LVAKTFTFANAAFAYANPVRGDVSPLQPVRSTVFFSGAWIPPGNPLSGGQRSAAATLLGGAFLRER
jgi:hypothetical protein